MNNSDRSVVFNIKKLINTICKSIIIIHIGKYIDIYQIKIIPKNLSILFQYNSFYSIKKIQWFLE
jgi:hypothetical protein